MLSRVGRAWRALAPEARLAAAAALLLFATMFLPWYQQNVVVAGDRSSGLQSQNLSAFGVFSFVEAAVLLVAIAVLVLLYARTEGRSFHLPGGDGLIVTIAGGWVVLLLVWRLFDKPELQGAGAGNMGIQWGIFFALGAAGLLAWAGVRMRAAHRPEPGPELRDDEPAPPPRQRRRRPAPPGTEMTRPLPPETEVAPPPPPPPADPPTRRLPDPPTERLQDPPTERLQDPPTRRLPDPPTERIPERDRSRERERDRPEPQTERLWDDR
ncbi:hypothetical protein Cwoe_1652 [Conexibacter woesei DSM 14684]|uniref:Uncharacterized protein n=1 Tax=Conexibacter woesei (strain DSM 14684 / CCUG 47730 / CIP 108061 / JCM 11494 / NBRC 100937 / ID131577) TaxID=469383 RepID=D3F103_CONWI|nr:hypothetical protein Cwoe_1652 [Conexibacter woesei DSM 14684]